MSTARTTTTEQPLRRSLADSISIVGIIVTMLISIGGGSLGFIFAAGSLNQKVEGVTREVQINKQDRDRAIDDIKERMVTREEMKAYLEGFQRDLVEIKTDVRELRNNLRQGQTGR